MNELQRQFLAEAEDLIEGVFRALEQLRLRRHLGRVRRELTGQIFRQVHTLKGSAASAEMDSISVIAHELENVLDGARLGRTEIDDIFLDTFEDATHAMSESLAAAHGTDTPVVSADLLQRLRTIAAAGVNKGPFSLAASRTALPPDIAAALSKYDEQRLREALAEGARLLIISANFPLTTFDLEFRDLSSRLAVEGEILATIPGTQTVVADEINFRVLYATPLPVAEIAGRILPTDDVTITELLIEREGEAPAEAAALSRESEPAAPLPGTETVRVSLAELDDLISRSSELFRDTMNALEATAAGSGLTLTEASPDLKPARLRQQFIELEDRLIELRMVPLAPTFERAARTGRLAARATGKEVVFEISGGDVAIDKSLAGVIADPLMHLVRNAVDHGIEPADLRIAAGKDARARVRLSALAESNRIQIYVEDDGRGIDPAHVARAAAQREIIADPSMVTFDQCLRLIFRPGFSTASEVSETSGRGIGLEIVDRAMAEAGGEVRVRTEPGRGTTFQMILPARLALVPTVVVQSGNNRYNIDTRYVVDSGKIETGETEAANSDQAGGEMQWRGETVPRRDLTELLGQGNGTNDRHDQSFLIIRSASGIAAAPDERAGDPLPQYFALVVDSIEGEHQALVRSLGRHATRWRGVAGATELRDGSVALVLDLPELLAAAREAESQP